MRGNAFVLAFVLIVPHAVAYAGDDDDAPKKDPDSAEQASEPVDDGGGITADQELPKKKKKKTKGKKKKHHKTDEQPASAEPASTEPAKEHAPAESVETVGIAEHDEAPPRARFSGELLGAGPLDSGNRQFFGYGGGVGVGAAIFATPMFDVHAGVELVHLASGQMSASDSTPSSTNNAVVQVGPRAHFASLIYGDDTANDAWVDVHFRYGQSGGIRRPGVDVGAAFQWEVSPGLRLGPVVRWQFGSDPRDKNAQLATIGLAVGYGGRARVATHVAGDADGDGITDADDQCPDEAATKHPDPERTGCPSNDRDDDGVSNTRDVCPDEPAGKHPDPSRVGCPFEDQDKDGIADSEDRCPDQPGPPDPFTPARHGCPQLAKVVANKIEILQEIFFETDSATIKSESFPVLEAVAGIVKHLPDQRVRVEGHTDQQGSDEYNLDLSKRRARAVAQWLITSGGIDAKRLETEGYGKSRPKVSGPSADLGQNRRVEFVLLEGN